MVHGGADARPVEVVGQFEIVQDAHVSGHSGLAENPTDFAQPKLICYAGNRIASAAFRLVKQLQGGTFWLLVPAVPE
ncbi:hypothetical protein Harman_26090 [Haloarcula mannanilytica]|uniref:Uncharacterized protein n=1 Tax=Haloarcula mannanilytica TaxID=2509225 RepID=A0A4C2EJK0_9EURY|nr:hypothetical protein Harman_26090 [Haloarcula mannanilytica]